MTDKVIIDGIDCTTTDAEARRIMGYLADQGVTEASIYRMPYRILVNRILAARVASKFAEESGKR